MREFQLGDRVRHKSTNYLGTIIGVGESGLFQVQIAVDDEQWYRLWSALSMELQPHTVFCPECEEEDYAFLDDYLCGHCRSAAMDYLDG